ncbi:MAG: NF038122 family metalloprotease [Planctomycetota bacterium]|nr:NF038122 family metalloprotease [Planctomycetota bacterium]
MYGPIREYPAALSLQQDGSWSIRYLTYGVSCGPFVPGQHTHIRGSETATIVRSLPSGRYEQINGKTNQPAAFIEFTYDHTDAPPYASQAQVQACLQRAISSWSDLLRDDNVPANIHFVWRDAALVYPNDPDLWDTTLAVTDRVSYSRQWDFQRFALLTFPDRFQDQQESLLYANLVPTPISSIPYHYLSFGSPRTTRTLWADAPIPLASKWYDLPIDDPAVIWMNNRMPANQILFDLDRRVGIPPIDVGSLDLEAVIVHELGHAFGFVSNTEPVCRGQTSHVTIWDLFRFPGLDPQTGVPAVDQSLMQNGNRQLVDGGWAVAATRMNRTDRTFRLSPGNGFADTSFPQYKAQASHWLNLSDPIGVMRPYFDPGFAGTMPNGSVFSEADRLAFDIMGYDIDTDTVFLPPAPAPQIMPPIGAIVSAASDLTLQWTAADRATSYSVGIDDFGPDGNGPAETVFFAEQLFSTSFIVPANTLAPGRQFVWYVNSESARGLNRTQSTFQTRCRADINADGQVDVFDYLDFAAAYSIEDPAADVNADGQVDVFDYLDFAAAYSTGC